MTQARTVGRRLAAAVGVFASFAVACTDRGLEPLDDVVQPPAPRQSPPNGGEVEVPTTAGRLVVIDEAGGIRTLRPDGSEVSVLAEGAGPSVRFTQPTWSPDGRRVAWSRVEATDGELSASLVTSAADGSELTEAPTDVAAFYLFWDPTSSRVAYLGSPAANSIDLGVVDVGRGGGRSVPLDSGQPYYFSWDPGGERMIVHVGADRLQVLELDGSLAPLGSKPGVFHAPAWSADGESFLYVSRLGRRQELVVHDVESGRTTQLAIFRGIASFVMSPDGSRVAFQVRGESGAEPPLSVIDVRTGRIREVSPFPALAYFWSPAGDRLLYMVSDLEPGETWFRWHVWDGSGSLAMSRFFPSRTFAEDYLPFFDQYAQSLTLWAPDGSAFAYSGINEDGDAGIWVQEAASGKDPVLVTGGTFTAWSSG